MYKKRISKNVSAGPPPLKEGYVRVDYSRVVDIKTSKAVLIEWGRRDENFKEWVPRKFCSVHPLWKKADIAEWLYNKFYLKSKSK